MTATREDLIACLHVKGFGKTAALAEALGAPAETVEAALAELVAGGDAEQFRVGVRLSASGKAAAQQGLAEERAGADHKRLEGEYERFTPLNAAFKALMSDWQMRPGEGKLVRNDHKDEAYDAAVLGRLPELHARAVALINEIAAHAPRIGGYRRRLSDALAKVQAGDHRYITAPDRDSYHTVWFELHQHIINLLGLTRQQEAAAGRAL
jgi:pyruvate,orthophosphate dikinase